jgi:tetraacyldisaccharide 4'-kinase
MFVRNLCYDRGICKVWDVGVPVISVGNLTVGGTGKTPFVEYLLRYFQQRKMRMAVVSRGYKRTTRGMVVVSDGMHIHCDVGQGGDEPVQIAAKFPGAVVIVDEARKRAAHCAVARFDVDGIILDDGFQHRSLRRDLDIVMVDGRRLPAWDALLPAGMRREPRSSLRRAQVAVILDGVSADEEQQRISDVVSLPCVRVRFVPTALRNVSTGISFPPGQMKGKTCVAFCGIAQPQQFYDMLTSLGIEVIERLTFPDHHRFIRSDWDKILSRLTDNAHLLCTTEKDAVRLRGVVPSGSPVSGELYYLEIEARVIDGEPRLHAMLDSIMKRVA